MTSTVKDPLEAAPIGLGLLPPPQLVASSIATTSPKKIESRIRRRQDPCQGIYRPISTIPGTMPSDAASIHSWAGSSAAVVTALIVSVEVPAGPALPGVMDDGEKEHFRLGGRFAHESWKFWPIAFCKALNEMLQVADWPDESDAAGGDAVR